jgi:hypothetical protein
VPQGERIQGWQRFAGSGDVDAEAFTYELWVNPARAALYEITRYRRHSAADGSALSNEMLLWNSRPGERVPLLCYERVARRRPWTLWLVRHWAWRPVPPGTPRYREEMARAIRIYELHRANLGLGTFAGD